MIIQVNGEHQIWQCLRMEIEYRWKRVKILKAKVNWWLLGFIQKSQISWWSHISEMSTCMSNIKISIFWSTGMRNNDNHFLFCINRVLPVLGCFFSAVTILYSEETKQELHGELRVIIFGVNEFHYKYFFCNDIYMYM